MNFVYLKTFLTVCELGNFTEAAKHLFVPQPTVSNRIRALEDELGQDLFLKGKRGKRVVELTKAGETFLPYAKQIIESMDIVKEKINSTGSRNELRLGSSIPPSHPVIYKYIKYLEEMEPNLSLDFVSKDSDILELFTNKTLDLAFVSEPLLDKELECTPLQGEEMELIISAKHPLSSLDRLEDITLLEAENLIFFSPFIQYFEHADLAKVKYNRRLMTNSLEVIKHFIKNNLGISFLPSQILHTEIDRGELINLPISKEISLNKINYFIVYRKNEANEEIYKSIL